MKSGRIPEMKLPLFSWMHYPRSILMCDNVQGMAKQGSSPKLPVQSFLWVSLSRHDWSKSLAERLNSISTHPSPPLLQRWSSSHLAQSINSGITWLVLLAYPAYILSHLISVNDDVRSEGPTMNHSKNTFITLQIPRVWRLPSKNQGQRPCKCFITR